MHLDSVLFIPFILFLTSIKNVLVYSFSVVGSKPLGYFFNIVATNSGEFERNAEFEPNFLVFDRSPFLKMLHFKKS